MFTVCVLLTWLFSSLHISLPVTVISPSFFSLSGFSPSHFFPLPPFFTPPHPYPTCILSSSSPSISQVPRVVAVSPQMRLVEDNPSSLSLVEIYKQRCAKKGIEHDNPISRYYDRLATVQARGTQASHQVWWRSCKQISMHTHITEREDSTAGPRIDIYLGWLNCNVTALYGRVTSTLAAFKHIITVLC